MASILELKEQKGSLWEKMKALRDKERGVDGKDGEPLSAEEEKQWDEMESDIQSLTRQIERQEKADEHERSVAAAEAESGTTREEVADTVVAELTTFFSREGPAGKGERTLDLRFTASDIQGERERERRDLLAGSGTGANVVPISFIRRLREHMIDNSGIRQTNVTVLTTSSGEELRVPKTTTHPTAALVAEAAAITENDPVFAIATLNAYKYGNLTQLSSEFLADEVVVNVLEYLARQNGIALGNVSGAHFITGTGSGQPQGLFVAGGAATGVTAANGTSQVTAVKGDSLIDLYHSVVSGYRRNSYWLMRDATLAGIRKIRDDTGGAGLGNYLWAPGLTVGAPDTLLGRPVVTDPTVPAMAASAKSIAFGDFSGYYIRDVGSVRFERSDDFAFSTDLVTFRALIRTDGELVDANAIKLFVNAAS